MSRRIIGAAVAALAAGGAAASIASATGDDSRPREHARVIELEGRTLQQTQLDLGDSGLGQGDRIVFREALRRSGRSVGENGGDCAVTAVEDATITAQCSLTFALRGGDITGQGLVTLGPGTVNTIAVTGGTGSFRAVGGEVRVELVEPGFFQYTVTLVR